MENFERKSLKKSLFTAVSEGESATVSGGGDNSSQQRAGEYPIVDGSFQSVKGHTSLTVVLPSGIYFTIEN